MPMGLPKGKDSVGNKGQTMPIESPSSSDSEGFLDEKSPMDNLRTGKKVPLHSLKSGGKAPILPKGDSGKEGKDGKRRMAEKQKEVVEVDAKLAIEMPKNAEILMDCEVATILQGIQEFLPSLSQDPSLKMPVTFTKALQHVQDGVQYTSSSEVRKFLNNLKKKGVSDAEVCMIANSCPETTEEAYALVPSLKENKLKNEEVIGRALDQLLKLRKVM